MGAPTQVEVPGCERVVGQTELLAHHFAVDTGLERRVPGLVCVLQLDLDVFSQRGFEQLGHFGHEVVVCLKKSIVRLKLVMFGRDEINNESATGFQLITAIRGSKKSFF